MVYFENFARGDHHILLEVSILVLMDGVLRVRAIIEKTLPDAFQSLF